MCRPLPCMHHGEAAVAWLSRTDRERVGSRPAALKAYEALRPTRS